MYSAGWTQSPQNPCSSLEINHFEDEDIKRILSRGFTPSHLLEAVHLIQEKEESPLLKLNLELESDTDVDQIGNLPKILDIACSSGTMRVTLDCIENARTESIMLKVQAPFSALMKLIGSNRTFKWLCAYPREMHRALRTLTEKTAGFCMEALLKGTPVISLADPSGMLELLGKKRYTEFCAFYALLLVRKLDPYLDAAVVHICPRTSLTLERLRLIRSEIMDFRTDNYANAVLELSKRREVRLLGHRCINAEHTDDSRIHVLKLNPPQIRIRRMNSGDWADIARIYDEGIRSGRVTVVKTLPDRERWLAAHRFCLIAEYLGNVIGFAALNDQTVPEISVHIEKDFRSQGVGTLLLNELQRRTGGRVRSLIFESNLPSVRLHEKMGFRRTGDFWFAGDPRKVLIYEWEAGDERTVV